MHFVTKKNSFVLNAYRCDERNSSCKVLQKCVLSTNKENKIFKYIHRNKRQEYGKIDYTIHILSVPQEFTERFTSFWSLSFRLEKKNF